MNNHYISIRFRQHRLKGMMIKTWLIHLVIYGIYMRQISLSIPTSFIIFTQTWHAIPGHINYLHHAFEPASFMMGPRTENLRFSSIFPWVIDGQKQSKDRCLHLPQINIFHVYLKAENGKTLMAGQLDLALMIWLVENYLRTPVYTIRCSST